MNDADHDTTAVLTERQFDLEAMWGTVQAHDDEGDPAGLDVMLDALRMLVLDEHRARLAAARPPQDDPQSDEREALARLIFLWDTNDESSTPAWSRLSDGEREVWLVVADVVLAAGFRRDPDAGLRERVRSTVEVAVNTAYGTDGRHGLLARHVAETVVTGKPLPWGLASHFGMSALAEPTPGSGS